MISMQYFSHCMGTCDEEENDVQSKMISNGRASATEDDVKVWVKNKNQHLLYKQSQLMTEP
jgi:hypothetical protein